MAVRLDVPGLDLADLHRRYTAGAASIKGEAERLGVSRKFLSKRYNRWLQAGGAAALDPQAPKPAPRLEASDKVTATGLKTGGLVLDSAQSPRIRTLAQLVEACEIDLDLWNVERHVVNKWEVGAVLEGAIVVEPLYQVKAWLVPRRDIVDARAAIAEQLRDMLAHAPSYPRLRPRRTAGPHLLELAIADLHLGLYSWAEETGATYDIETVEALLPAVVRDLAERAAAAWDIGEVLVYLGGDILHADRTIAGAGGSTANGTPLDMAGRWAETFVAARRALVASIDPLQARWPVRLISKAGNHDEQGAFGLGDSLASWYRNADNVTVDNAPAPYTLWRWGSNLLGFTHGHLAKPAKLALIMATEASAEDWAASADGWREWHIGHTHAAKLSDTVLLDEERRVRVRTVPSLSAPDAWHARMGYAHRRVAEAYVWHRSSGFSGMMSASPPGLEPREGGDA